MFLSNHEAGHRARAGPGFLTSVTFAPCHTHTLHAWLDLWHHHIQLSIQLSAQPCARGSDKICLVSRRGTGFLADHHQPLIHI